MWVIVRTLKGKNSFLTGSGEWAIDRTEAELFDQFDYAVYHRDKAIPLRERRGVGVVKAEIPVRQSPHLPQRLS